MNKQRSSADHASSHNITNEAVGGDGCGVGRTGPAEGNLSEGAPPSNTAPSTCNNDSEVQILRCGLDSLYLSYHGEIYEETAIRFKECKTLAQSRDPERVKLAQTSFGRHAFKIHDRGSRPYEYVLSDAWYRIQVAGLFAERLPLAHVKIASTPLTLEGPRLVVADLNDFVQSLGVSEDAPTVSRADICVDFVTSTDISALTNRQFVTRARKFDRFEDAREFTGLLIGKGGGLSARLYNKTLEIKSSGKAYMLDVWRDCGWDGFSDIWRLEFQYRRDVLRQLNVASFEDLMDSLGGLWLYASCDWLRLTLPNVQDSTPSRWPTHPLWLSLQEVDWGPSFEVTKRTAPTSAPPSDSYLFQNGLSGLISFMAREGITDALDGASAYHFAAAEFHNARTPRTGLTFEDYIEQKVALKMREFGTFANSPPPGERHPADEAVAKAYWRRSDGL